jgi:hypothetical protein
MVRSGVSSNNVLLPVAPGPNIFLSHGTKAIARGFCRVRIGVMAGVAPVPTSGPLLRNVVAAPGVHSALRLKKIPLGATTVGLWLPLRA